MPHKHRRTEHDESQFDLPPSIRAAPLPVRVAHNFQATQQNRKRKKVRHVQGYGEDDTPKAFQRLINLSASSAKKRSALDTGASKPKRAKTADNQASAQNASLTTVPELHTAQGNLAPEGLLKIQPGESMAAYSARVDSALPLAGVSRSKKKVAGISSHRVTKHERRLKRLQQGWREEEARIREKEQEAQELAEDEKDEHAAIWQDSASGDMAIGAQGEEKRKKNQQQKKKKKKKKKGKGSKTSATENASVESDGDWEALERTREQRKGLHDVVSAPPVFHRLPREIFRVKNGAGAKVGNVPNSAGSLSRREQLGEERRTIINTYRELATTRRRS